MELNYKQHNWYFIFTTIATILAFCAILLGTYTRLKDAGLGCPDWPGCYGQMTVPNSQSEISQAMSLFPNLPLEPGKAWLEMVHRYFAGTLGLIIFFLAIWAPIRKFRLPDQPIVVPLILALLVIFQATLGMWTVTWQLHPLVVMGHLLGGMTILALLWWLFLKTGRFFQNYQVNPISGSSFPLFAENAGKKLQPWAILGIIVVGIQIFLGGWTSANYASLACTSFPTCNGGFFPMTDFHQAFNFLNPTLAGNLPMPARVAIHLTHRFWGLVTGFYLIALSVYLIATRRLKNLGWIIVILIGLQIILGILNVKLLLPLPIALAHTAVAAFVLLSLVTLIYMLYSIRAREVK